MPVKFRLATRKDVPEVMVLISDDFLGKTREHASLDQYLAAFDQMQQEGANHLIVGETETGEIAATYQLTFISGLSLSAARRAQIEAVRVAKHLRGEGVGEAMFADAEARARGAGCTLMQLTMNQSRKDANRFYERIGFVPTHVGFKKPLI